ncbi:hypothetical protein SODALDRAFT_359446 [Sodiomyces alkalinus F11]|uniref:Uncharacterized protein n=1 Tax=Sodiomyces alkalinus (strain CBS 110278 / VKM F-3762 / F11) TaxID=1314773 RepID=A0A3N2PV28_SODAK|nr:hypothetical protein SODALDRAFT_359446 [Sodiomyces alkalinus F11]ROT38363.1 hypothetical protein SODALDRAFT_359446 [Sodiomyces alkalinus F11]
MSKYPLRHVSSLHHATPRPFPPAQKTWWRSCSAAPRTPIGYLHDISVSPMRLPVVEPFASTTVITIFSSSIISTTLSFGGGSRSRDSFRGRKRRQMKGKDSSYLWLPRIMCDYTVAGIHNVSMPKRINSAPLVRRQIPKSQVNPHAEVAEWGTCLIPSCPAEDPGFVTSAKFTVREHVHVHLFGGLEASYIKQPAARHVTTAHGWELNIHAGQTKASGGLASIKNVLVLILVL